MITISLSPYIVTYFFHVMKSFKIYSFSNFQMYNTVLLSIVTMLYIKTLEHLFYNWEFVPFNTHHPFRLHSHSLPLPITNLFSVFVSCFFFFFFWWGGGYFFVLVCFRFHMEVSSLNCLCFSVSPQ